MPGQSRTCQARQSQARFSLTKPRQARPLVVAHVLVLVFISLSIRVLVIAPVLVVVCIDVLLAVLVRILEVVLIQTLRI